MKTKRFLAWVVSLAMAATLFTTFTVSAADAVSYVEFSRSNGILTSSIKTATSYEEVTDSTTAVTWETGTYVVKGEVAISNRVLVEGDVKLILTDGCKLTVGNKGILVHNTNSLTIYGQSGGTGVLEATVSDGGGSAAIGGSSSLNIYKDSGNITIHGGNITANVVQGTGSGIGGGHGGTGNVTIYGGVINASGNTGSGIGGGHGGTGNVTIYGGDITAEGNIGAGIGGGSGGVGNVTIYDGVIDATGNLGAGIGGGQNVSGSYTITIFGGVIIDKGNLRDDIGCGNLASGSSSIALLGGKISSNKSSIDIGKKGSNNTIFDMTLNNTVIGSYTLTENVTIPADMTLTFSEGAILTIPAGVTLNNKGKIDGTGEIIGNVKITGNGSIADTVTTTSITLATELTLTTSGVTIENLSESAILIVASYNGSQFVDSKTVPVSADCTTTIASTGLTLTGANTIKAFLWKDMSGFVPLCESDFVAYGN